MRKACMSIVLGSVFLFHFFIFGVTLAYAYLCMHVLVSLLKMAAMLGMLGSFVFSEL